MADGNRGQGQCHVGESQEYYNIYSTPWNYICMAFQ